MRCALAAMGCSLLALAGTIGCSSPAARPAESTLAIPANEPPLATPSDKPATIIGTAPAATGDIPSVVVLEPRAPLRYPRPTVMPLMDQVAHQFTPPVLVVRTGQQADFRNDDDTMHNVRVFERDRSSGEPMFNVVLPQGGSYKHAFPHAGAYDVRCDMHQSMHALVVSTSSPYAAVADNAGGFTLEGVAPGPYTLIAYSGDARLERSVDLAESERLNVDLR
jgi:Copper binding proteins, plastocyanin/azurin family